MSKDWELLSKEKISGDFYNSLEKWKFKTHDNKEKDYSIVVGPDIVIVFGITQDEKVLVLKEYFMTTQKRILSLVAGIVDKEKSLEDIAAEELREETGYVAEEIVYLGKLIRGKYTDGLAHFFLAKNVVKKYEQDLEDGEDIEVDFIELEEFKNKLRKGELSPLYEYAGAYMALDYLKKI